MQPSKYIMATPLAQLAIVDTLDFEIRVPSTIAKNQDISTTKTIQSGISNYPTFWTSDKTYTLNGKLLDEIVQEIGCVATTENGSNKNLYFKFAISGSSMRVYLDTSKLSATATTKAMTYKKRVYFMRPPVTK